MAIKCKYFRNDGCLEFHDNNGIISKREIYRVENEKKNLCEIIGCNREQV